MYRETDTQDKKDVVQIARTVVHRSDIIQPVNSISALDFPGSLLFGQQSQLPGHPPKLHALPSKAQGSAAERVLARQRNAAKSRRRLLKSIQFPKQVRRGSGLCVSRFLPGKLGCEGTTVDSCPCFADLLRQGWVRRTLLLSL